MSNHESVNELKLVRLCDIPERKVPTRWGRWRHNQSNNTLEFWDDLRGNVYYIDLDSASTSAAACLDWIMQVSPKRWMTPVNRSDLLLAIRDLVNPQARLCSFAMHQGRHDPPMGPGSVAQGEKA